MPNLHVEQSLSVPKQIVHLVLQLLKVKIYDWCAKKVILIIGYAKVILLNLWGMSYKGLEIEQNFLLNQFKIIFSNLLHNDL